jgi:Co/Zn/Cd efflux system component
VIIGGTLNLLYDWRIIDPPITLMIAGYILWQSFPEIGGVIRILMRAVRRISMSMPCSGACSSMFRHSLQRQTVFAVFNTFKYLDCDLSDSNGQCCQTVTGCSV